MDALLLRSWYYTPVGLTWWSYDPWGWYPFHYGNWFFDAGCNRWCWAPGYVYSPAWVYWGYTPGYVGWCPVGYYSFFSPWWDTYYRQLGLPLALEPRTSRSTARSRPAAWTSAAGTSRAPGPSERRRARMDVVPGTRIADRLGAQVAISSRPIVVDPREGGVREALRTYVREAPRTIERTAGVDSERLAPVLARERTLPADTVAALRERAVVAERGRLAGPTAAEIAPRGRRRRAVARSALGFDGPRAGRRGSLAGLRARRGERHGLPRARPGRPGRSAADTDRPALGRGGVLASPRQRATARNVAPRPRGCPAVDRSSFRPPLETGAERIMAIALRRASRAPGDRRRGAGAAGARESLRIAAPRRGGSSGSPDGEREKSRAAATSVRNRSRGNGSSEARFLASSGENRTGSGLRASAGSRWTRPRALGPVGPPATRRGPARVAS